MPIQAPGNNPFALPARQARLGAPKRSLDPVPAEASGAELKALFDANLGRIMKGNKPMISKAEASWIDALVHHPNAQANAGLLAHLRASLEGVPVSGSAAALGFDALIAALPARADIVPDLPPPGGLGQDAPVVADGPAQPGGGIIDGRLGNPEAPVIAGRLTPVGACVKLTPVMKAVTGPAAKALSPAVINEEFNPHRALLGDFASPASIFEGRCFVPTQTLIGAAIQKAPEQAQAILAPLLAALPKGSIYTSGAMQFAVDGPKQAPGNRVVFYGGAEGHKNIDVLVSEAGKKHQRLLKQMVHFVRESQGGSPQDIVGDGVAGATHCGGFSAGFLAGKPASIKSDWPSDYGHLGDDNRHYNANLLAVDYQAGTRQQIPERCLAAYKQNADMIDAIAGAIVPFASGDLDPRYTNYKFNPLEVHDNASAGQVMQDLAKLDRKTMLQKHGAFYCAEGQYSVASMGAKDNCLLKKEAFAGSPLETMIETFQQAPGLLRNEAGQITNPERGWQYLVQQNLLTQAQYDGLEETGRTAIGLQWIEPDIQGWENFGCKNPEGMIAEPMSVATMAWALLRTYMPREGLAQTVANDVMHAFKVGTPEVKQGVVALLGGHLPSSPEGQAALQSIALQSAGGLLLQILGSDEFRDKLLHQAGFEEITNDADKGKVLDLYKEFLGALQNADIHDQAALDAAVKGIDRKFKDLVVERNDFDPLTGETTGQRMTSMQYAAPQCMSFWAQQPDLFGSSGAIKYLATAMHDDQAK